MLNVVLVDRGLHGHHLSFNRTFSKILLKLGCRVFLLVPGSPSLVPWIEKEVSEQSHNFFPIDSSYNFCTPKRPGRLSSLTALFRRWKSIANQIKTIEVSFGFKVNLVFFSWIDDYLGPYLHPWILDRIFPWKWSGLYFHPYHLRLERKYLSKKLNWRDADCPLLSNCCISVCIHDRSIAHDLQYYRYRKSVNIFAETADCSRPDPGNALAVKIRELAKSRVVVGMIGCEAHKGLDFAMNIANKADQSKYFFLFAGNQPVETFSPALLKKWNAFVTANQENILCVAGSIDEGPGYNSVFCAIDIHLLVYENFISSSNRLTKAAFLERLVLTDNHYCIGDDVRAYGLGEVIPSKDVIAAIEALARMEGQLRCNMLPFSGWKDYRELNSELALFNSFESIVTMLRPDRRAKT